MVHESNGFSASTSSSTTTTNTRPSRFVGFDLGTSGARISIIEKKNENENDSSASASASASSSSSSLLFKEVFSDSIAWDKDGFGSYNDPNAWMNAVRTLLSSARDSKKNDNNWMSSIRSMCVSGTSASCCCIRQPEQQPEQPEPEQQRRTLMYNDNIQDEKVKAFIERHVPSKHTARATTGMLAKLLYWHFDTPIQEDERLYTQSDYVSSRLLEATTKQQHYSDWHNILKLGYDVRKLEYPPWFYECLKDAGIIKDDDNDDDNKNMVVVPHTIVSPGCLIGNVDRRVCHEFGLGLDCKLVAGTTDSNAAFVAAVGGISAPYGTAVTSLGSTLAIKQLGRTHVEDADRGVYSHRFPTMFVDNNNNNKKETTEETTEEASWLIGGASNVGCAVLRQEGFSNEELEELSQTMDVTTPSPYDYYPLTLKGERFPVANPELLPVLEPKPDSRQEYLKGILQGISKVEKDGFKVLQELSSGGGGGGSEKTTTTPTTSLVYTSGGGSKNDAWMAMRQTMLSEAFGHDVVVTRAPNTEASYGAALLAASTFL